MKVNFNKPGVHLSCLLRKEIYTSMALNPGQGQGRVNSHFVAICLSLGLACTSLSALFHGKREVDDLCMALGRIPKVSAIGVDFIAKIYLHDQRNIRSPGQDYFGLPVPRILRAQQ